MSIVSVPVFGDGGYMALTKIPCSLRNGGWRMADGYGVLLGLR